MESRRSGVTRSAFWSGVVPIVLGSVPKVLAIGDPGPVARTSLIPGSTRDGGVTGQCASIARRYPFGDGRRSTGTRGVAGAGAAAVVVGPGCTGAGAWTCRVRTFAFCTVR